MEQRLEEWRREAAAAAADSLAGWAEVS